MVYRETSTHKGDVFTKALAPASFVPAVERLGMRVARLPLLNKKGKPLAVVFRVAGGVMEPDDGPKSNADVPADYEATTARD